MIKIITDYLDRSSKKHPNKVAFKDDIRAITFADVVKESQKIATHIIKASVFRKPVMVYMDKCVECINAFMGVAYSGNYYTPVDINMPDLRISKIIETLKPEIILTDYRYAEKAKSFASNNTDILLYEELQKGEIDIQAIAEIREKLLETDVLYVLFTSGSTGMPKGVIVSHKAVITYSDWVGETFDISDKTIFGNQAPFYFVMSTLDIYQTIRAGATTIIIPKKVFSFPIVLLEYLKDNDVNTLYWVPSALCAAANIGAVEELHVDKLKLVMFSGEVMPTKQLNMWINEYPDVKFVNLYGPTETADVCAYFIVDREFDDIEVLPIGKPCEHMDILLLDDNCFIEATGEGEICARGPSLAYGYYNEPAKTREVFIQNPNNSIFEETIYRTGDFARYNEKGELVFISRKDSQIKHMGNRIELGEIEAAASSIDNVYSNCCIYDKKRSMISLYYVGNIDKADIKIRLSKIIPEYMIPQKIVKLKEMPKNLNGKIDRVKLNELL